ncbi:MAG: nucleotide pyrophosphohydrolase [Planctomycetota bacterium]
MIPLLGLAGEAGSLLSEYKKWLREGKSYLPFQDQVSEELGDIMWYVATIASRNNLSIEDIAKENLAKLYDLYGDQDAAEPAGRIIFNFDHAYPSSEQLPRHLQIELRDVSGKLDLVYNGSSIGDRLTDNSHIQDGYRFHDVFHFGCGVLLGWSPVMRRIFKCKRKSEPTVDEVEDGARALVTEEGVSAFVFEYARKRDMLKDAKKVSYDLLRTIRDLVSPFEVRVRSLSEWNDAIIKIYAVWRPMIESRGGIFVGDPDAGTLSYEPLPATPVRSPF